MTAIDKGEWVDRVGLLQCALDAYRSGAASGIRALDADHDQWQFGDPLGGALAAMSHSLEAEQELLAGLLRVYGGDLLSSAYFGPGLRLIGQQGAGGFLQHVLLGESAAATELTAMLAEAHEEFVKLAERFPCLLVGDARSYLKNIQART